MKMKMNNWLWAVMSSMLILGISCNDDETPMNNPCDITFDQKALFQHYADSLIRPILTDFGAACSELEVAMDLFTDSPDATRLEMLQTAFAYAYLAYQRTGPAAFGPAEEVFWRNSLNNFPLNVGQVAFNIENGGYDLSAFDTYDKGFPALDYLLYGLGDEADILAKYTTDPLAANYRQYLDDLIHHLQGVVQPVVEAWTTGDYSATFQNNTGTAAGTSLSLLINALNENYETIKRDKIGFPSGVLTLDFPNPEAVEAVYSGLSSSLAREAILATRWFYQGASWLSGSEGPGLDDYLVAAEASRDGQSLDELIEMQFDLSIGSLDALPTPLSTAATDATEDLQMAYVDIEKQVLYLKTDLPSVLCVAITYVDNPSDSD